MATARKYDLYSDRFRAETYETFARMRDEDGVFCQPGIDGETMLWFITRHDDAMAGPSCKPPLTSWQPRCAATTRPIPPAGSPRCSCTAAP